MDSLQGVVRKLHFGTHANHLLALMSVSCFATCTQAKAKIESPAPPNSRWSSFEYGEGSFSSDVRAKSAARTPPTPALSSLITSHSRALARQNRVAHVADPPCCVAFAVAHKLLIL